MINRANVIKYILLILVSMALFFAVCQDYGIYDRPIAEITEVQEEAAGEKAGALGATEDYFVQSITAKIMNLEHKGELVRLSNIYGESLVYDDKYHKGNAVFIDNIKATDGGLTANIAGQKRDHLVVALVLILLNLLVMVGGRQGFFTILCMLVNSVLLFGMLSFYNKGANILALTVLVSLVFCFIILVLINGINKKTGIAFAASTATIAFVTALAFVVIKLSPDLDYEFLEYLIHPYEQSDVDLLFLSEILMGCVGAVIDISVTITSCATELIQQDRMISGKALIKSCRNVSDDITGTMINVMFFTNIAACIPLFVVSMQNEIGIFTVLKHNIFFELARFLTGSIGIVMAIPFSILAVYLSYGRREGKC